MPIKGEENNMPVNMTPARRCRFSNYNGSRYFNHLGLIPEDFDFEYHERRLYKLSIEIKQEEEAKGDLEKSKTAIYMASIGLFCFGHLEVIDDIINYFKFVPRPVKVMAIVLRELLPLPHEIGIDTPDLLKQWVSENRNRLEWSEGKGKYLLLER
jgi:hypothetical protein